jgi:hypothetical protein
MLSAISGGTPLAKLPQRMALTKLRRNDNAGALSFKGMI